MSRPVSTSRPSGAALSRQCAETGQGRGDSAAGGARRVKVMLPLPLHAAYDYRVPEGMALAPGDIVEVPLGRRVSLGVVWGEADDSLPESRLKPVRARADAPPLGEDMRRFIDWVARYTMSPPGAVLKMAISVAEALQPPRQVVLYRLGTVPPTLKMTPARRRLVEFMASAPALPLAELARLAGVGTAVVKGLVESGVVEAELRAAAPPPGPRPDWRRDGHSLSPAQQAAAAELVAKVEARAFSTTLIDGVPGSGKTEVYFEAIAAALKAGRQVLVLLPEIALSAQWLERFARRFGAPPAAWHSDVPASERRRTWRAVAEGRAGVVVGARSALFLPFADLGLVVVDEEHDGAFKQEDGVIYNARDMAVVRASLGGFPAVLVSATPSLESAVNAQGGRYDFLHLPERHGEAVLPAMQVVDLRRQPPPRGRWLSPPLEQAMRDTLAAGEQVLLFLNRRGYAPLTLCRACGHRLHCPNCTAWLVEHRALGRLTCHHCGYGAPRPHHCPSCEAEDSFVACGPGVERVAEEVERLFPEARRSLLASDTVGGPRAAQALIAEIAAHEVDIVIGTQIVAKGHHFPGLTLVGVIDSDLGLAGGDLRAAERTYQLLYQVAGRAGRESRPGRVLLQTYQPDHPVIRALAAFDRDTFLAAEKAARRQGGMPPYGRLAALIVSGRDEAEVEAAAQALGRAAPQGDELRVLGPAPAPLALLRGRHRRRLLLQASRRVNVQAVLGEWLGRVKVPGSVRVQIDVDPMSFL